MVENASTVIGPSIIVSGNLSGDEDLTVLGRVEGNINLTKTLVIEESGIVKADVSVRNVVISGIVVGNIEASDSVEILDGGRMVGDIKAPRVIIVDGARFRGNVDMGNLEAPRASGPLPSKSITAAPMSRPASRPATRPQPAARKPTPAPPPKKAASGKPKRPVPGKKKIKKKVVVKKKRR